VVSLLLVRERGPFFYSFSADPAYVYLVSSLNVAILRFDLIGHTDHPGTPLQLFGGIVIRFLHPFDSDSVLINKIFENPEFYITAIVWALIALTFLVFFVSGLMVYRSTESLWLALLVQAGPFFSSLTVYESLARFRPETPLVFVTQLLITFVVISIFGGSHDKKDPMLYLKFSILSGLGLALKYTFLPLILLPLVVLNGRKEKIKYLIVTFLVFTIFIVPILPQFHRSLEFVAVNILSTQAYGSGSFGLWEPHIALNGVTTLLIAEPVMFFLVLMFPIFLIYFRLSGRVPKNFSRNSRYRLILICLVIISLQLIIFFKNHTLRYFLPTVFLTIPFGLAFFSLISSYMFNGKLSRAILASARVKLVLGVFLIFYISLNLYNYFDVFKKYSVNRREQHKILSSSQGLKLFGYMCSVPDAGLYLGNSYSNYYYSDHYTSVYGDAYTFNAWKKPYKIEYLGQLSMLSDIIGESGKLVFCGLGWSFALFEEYVNENGYELKRLNEPYIKYTSDEVVVEYEVRKL